MECATCAAVQANIRAVKDKAIETGKLVAVMQARKVALETAYGEVEEFSSPHVIHSHPLQPNRQAESSTHSKERDEARAAAVRLEAQLSVHEARLRPLIEENTQMKKALADTKEALQTASHKIESRVRRIDAILLLTAHGSRRTSRSSSCSTSTRTRPGQ